MARLDEFIFGYYRGKVEQKDAQRLIRVLMKLNICSDVTQDGYFTLRQKDKGKFIKYCKSRMRFELNGPYGIYGALYRGRRRFGLFAAIAVLSLLFALTGGRVWDIRVSGNEQLSEDTVVEALDKSGFGVGTLWRKTDKNGLESDVLAENPEIAWISVNRRGTVAYVELIESENVAKNPLLPAPDYSNVVAKEDGVIVEITVESGVAAVKVGDVVRAGDVLISGVIETEGYTGLCRAKGEIRAECVKDVSVISKSEQSEKTVVSRRVAHIKLLIFNFSINIFKNYGNCENNCDIIEEIRSISLFGKYRLPVRISQTYVQEYTYVSVTRTNDELLKLAKHKTDERIRSEFQDSDIIKLKTESYFKDGALYLNTRVVYTTDIGKEIEIKTD